jgi:GTP-binding protein LepA
MVRVFDGSVKPGMKIRFMKAGAVYEVTEVGYFTPKKIKCNVIHAGEVGYILANIKTIEDIRIGDTVTEFYRETATPLMGYKEPKPMVFSGLYPIDGDDYPLLREALEKLKLNDSSLYFEPETSKALGFGFRCGFLGLLHLEIVKERLTREYNVSLIATIPGVIYRLTLTNGEVITVDNPSNFPDRGKISVIEEPMVKATMILPSEYVGAIMELCNKRRGRIINMEYLAESRVLLYYHLPLNEILVDFFNQLKALSKGYASLDYEFAKYETADLVKVDILLNAEPVDAFSFITHKDNAYYRGRDLTGKLRKLIPRQMFEIPIQASIGSKVISRETISALRKNVLAKCYGGDITRKRKLLEKQKEGKRRMKSVGRVEIPEEAFLSILMLDSDNV